MKKAIVIIFVVLAIIVALIVAGNVALDSFRAFLMGEPDVIQEVVSPDGKYVAYVFEANGLLRWPDLTASWRLHRNSLAPPWASPGLGAADSREVTQRPCPPGADALEKQTELPSRSCRKSQRVLVALHLLSLDQAGQQRLREAEVFAQGRTAS